MTPPTCPTADHPVRVGADTILSRHRTASGVSAYVRCSCGGLAVVSSSHGGPWGLVSHAAPAAARVPAGIATA